MPSYFGVDLGGLIQAIGYVGVTLIVFAESGLLIGFFLPGDSLLITAGLLASQGYFSFPLLAVLAVVGAVVGDSVGYVFGRRLGPRVFTRDDSFLFRRSHVQAASAFYEKHGGKTIILARFMPIVRTFAPIVAGVSGMSYRRFFAYNVIGGVLWGGGIVALGYYLGTLVPGIDRYILLVIAVILLASVLPPVIHVLRDPGQRAALRKVVGRRRNGTQS
jgi:membrane-associated protein